MGGSKNTEIIEPVKSGNFNSNNKSPIYQYSHTVLLTYIIFIIFWLSYYYIHRFSK